MSKLDHRGEAFEIDPRFALSGGPVTEQREFDDWLRRIGGWVGGSQPEAPPVAQKGVEAAYRRVEPKVTRAVAPAKPGLAPEKVCWIQNVLNKANGEALIVDGIYGPATRAAAMRFQAGRGLTVDGVVGPRTEVALIQAGLNQIAQASVVPVNGVMDPQTSQQIRRFQSAKGLASDGIVGPRTRAAMVLALGGQCRIPAARPAPSPGAGWVGGAKPPPKPGTCDPAVVEGLLKACGQDELLCKAGCGLDGLISQIKQIPELAGCAELGHPGLIVACVLAKGGVPFIDALFKAKECWEDCSRNAEFCQLNAQRCVR
jgi:peptidoglycan hydrolase-like protein with peptidoglycan-binding domain